jgi:hypothetical protein
MYQITTRRHISCPARTVATVATLAEARRFLYGKFGPENVHYETDDENDAADAFVYTTGDIFAVEPIKE